MKFRILFILTLFFIGYPSIQSGLAQTKSLPDQSFLNVGHRGARGLMPENTIPSFKKAIEVGANTLEFDVHITKDNQVVIYHDNSFTPSYTTKPDGSEIKNSERKELTFYQMDYSDIKEFIIGEKFYTSFPDQKRLKSYAPLLSEMIDSIESFTESQGYSKVNYLLEIKSSPNADGYGQPDNPEDFMKILMEDLKPYLNKLKSRLIIQSFDMRPLQVLNKTHPDIPLGFLTGDNTKTIDQNIKELGFTPDYYNPNQKLLNVEFLKITEDKNMKVLPWTVNEVKDIQHVLKYADKIDGIISDFPNRVQRMK